MPEILDFARDNERFKYFVRESVEHGAKLEIRTFQWLVDHYTKAGNTILDPMSGIGTVHLAAVSGRNTVAIELNDRFVEIQHLNIKKLATEHGLTGTTKVLHGDARMWLPQPCTAVIFSPPYGSVFKKPAVRHEMFKEKSVYKGYGDEFANIGNITIYPVYLESMKNIYKLCLDSLPPAGYCILITKDYVKNRERVMVTADTLRVCLDLGFKFEDWHRRVVNETIWQIMNRERREMDKFLGRYTVGTEIHFEDILVLRKAP